MLNERAVTDNNNIETLHCIIGKAIFSATHVDIKSLHGADQLCGGVKSGIEGAIHAMNELYSQQCTFDDWVFWLVSNEMHIIYGLTVLIFLFSTYSGWAALVVHDS